MPTKRRRDAETTRSRADEPNCAEPSVQPTTRTSMEVNQAMGTGLRTHSPIPIKHLGAMIDARNIDWRAIMRTEEGWIDDGEGGLRHPGR